MKTLGRTLRSFSSTTRGSHMYVVKPERVAEARLAEAEDVAHRQPEQIDGALVEERRVAASQSQAVHRHVAVGERHALGVARRAARVEHHPGLIERDGVHRPLEGARVVLGSRAAPTREARDQGTTLRFAAGVRHRTRRLRLAPRGRVEHAAASRAVDAARCAPRRAYALQASKTRPPGVDEDDARVAVLDDVRRLLRGVDA